MLAGCSNVDTADIALAERNALGRSHGGFSTKINARTNAEVPIGIVITPGKRTISPPFRR